MHPLAVKEIVKVCRQREREGDRPATPAPSVEALEDAVVSLADMLRLALAPDEECEAGVLHWDAPRSNTPQP